MLGEIIQSAADGGQVACLTLTEAGEAFSDQQGHDVQEYEHGDYVAYGAAVGASLLGLEASVFDEDGEHLVLPRAC